MGGARERGLLGVAAGIVVAGLAALPFAGGLASTAAPAQVATGPGEASTAVPSSSTATTLAPPPSTTATTAAPLPDVVVEPPPIEIDDPSAGLGPAPDAPLPDLPPSPPPTPMPTPTPLEDDPALAVPIEPAPPSPSAELPPPGPDGGVVVADAPAEPPTTAPPETTTTTIDLAAADPGRVWAVAIGIDDYPGTTHDLRAARRDATTVVDSLRELGVPSDHILELLDEEATLPGVVGAADWLAANAGPDDVAVFFYAGHVRKLGPGTELVVTAEGGWIADWYLGNALTPMRAEQAWMVIAGCYGGGFDELLAPGRVLTGAAPPGLLAYENDIWGRSYLVEYVFERALRQGLAGAPTVQGAVGWAMDRLAEEEPAHQLWNVDDSASPISLDGARRGGEPPPEAPTTTGTSPPARRCPLGRILC